MADQFNRDIQKEMQKFSLHFAAMAGDLPEVKSRIDAGYPLNRFDELGKTPLHYAVDKSYIEVIKYLLASGADINAHDERVAGNTPLRDVAQTCSLTIARLLIESGADPRIPGSMQITALQAAQERTDPQGHAIYKLMKRAAESFDHTD